MKKRIASTVLALSLTLGISTTALGVKYSSNVILNDNKLELEEIHIDEKEQIMFPIRTITEKLDYLVKWDGVGKNIELSKGTDIINLKVGSSKAVVNGKEIDLNKNIIIKNGKTFIPTQFFDKALGLSIGWDDDKKILKINNPTEKPEKYFEISEDEIVRKNIDDYMNSLSEYQNFQGSLLVGKDDKLIISKGYGLANVEQNIMNKSQTKFAIGSITKQFTAMAIMQLSEKDLIDVEDKVSKYVPELQEGEKITIHNLLTHTSGLKNYTELPEFLQSDFSIKDPMNMVNLIKDMPLEFKSGEIFQYSNTNYLLLGMIVEKITGMTLEDYLEENILSPLNMENTGVAYGKDKIAPDATPYVGFIDIQAINDKLVLNQAYGAGNMYSTVEDLYRWDRALKTEKLVSKETLEKMFESHIMFSEYDGYGYGLMITDTEDGKKIGHGGNTFGFSSNLDRYIDKDLTVIALTNKGYYDVAGLTENIKNISLKKEYEKPEKLEEIKIEDKEIYNRYIGKYKVFDEIMDDFELTITEREGNLYAQAKGQGSFEIFPLSEKRFFAKVADLRIEFTNGDEKASKLTLEQVGQKFIYERIDEDKEAVPLEPVEVDIKIYEEYAGEYEIAPGIIITITNEDERIYAKLTGQDKYEIFPLSENEYFYKVVDAKILFERDEEGNVVSLTLEQNAEEMPGLKN